MCLLYRLAFACATRVFFQNSTDAEELVQRKVLSQEKCVIIPGSGIDTEEYPFCSNEEEHVVFFMATRLLIAKGVREYCEAARMVRKQYPDVHFELAGSFEFNGTGISKDELYTYTEKGIIDYLGHISDMKTALKRCSVFVLPSYYREGVPHAILEAMSTGRAIITCDSPGCKDTIKNPDGTGKGANGILVKPRDSTKLAMSMIWMIEHTNERMAMGIEGRKFAVERFDVNDVNHMILKTMGIAKE